MLSMLPLLEKEIEPDIVFGPSTGDFHQECPTLVYEMIRTFKDKVILSKVFSLDKISKKNQVYLETEKKSSDENSKEKVCHKSQTLTSYMAPYKIIALTIVNGIDMDLNASKKFEAVRASYRSDER